MNILNICEKKLFDLGLHENVKYKKRLDWEIKEIKSKEKEYYFIDLFTRKVKYAFNQNNLLVCWLLGIVPDFDIDKNPNCVYGEFPDIDTDYIPLVRNYIKEVWAPKEFGEDYVCNISNYTTFGIKSALIDMARVHGESKDEIHAITKNIEAKDEDGKVLTWDAAMRLYPELKKYCELDDNHRKISVAAKKLLHRNRGMNVHAGGLIIANAPLSDLVPLVKRKDTPQASAWVEGLSGQDLGPVGLVKFDLLVIANLLQIARCCDMVKRRHSLDGICNKPGESDWTDVPAWRNDPLALNMANSGDLKCIFQFESDGMRAIVRSGGVDRFEDLVAYSSLFRPGPLGEKMQERYIERKKGREKYTLHPLVKPILEDTYGVMIFQEQTMKMLNVVGEIPLKDCELVRKAISKKKVEGFIKHKEMFVLNGQKNLGCSEDEINNIWNQLLSWSEYGFNKTIEQNTIILTPCGPKKICDFRKGDKVYCIDESGNRVETEVKNLHDHGMIEVHTVTFDDGYEITCTLDHKFLTENGQMPLWKILNDDLSVLSDKQSGLFYAKEKIRRLEDEVWSSGKKQERYESTSNKLKWSFPSRSNVEGRVYIKKNDNFISSKHGMFHNQYRINENGLVDYVPIYASISNTRNLVPRKIVRIMSVGKRQCYDLEVANPTHNFILPSGIVTSNSHAVAYTYISSWLLYLKAHYPHEFYAATLSCETLSKKIKDYKMEAKIHGVEVVPLDINKSCVNFDLQGDLIYFGFSNIKGLGEVPAKRIVDGQPYKSFEDFLTRFGTEANVLKPIIGLRCFKDSDPITLWKFAEHFKDRVDKLKVKNKQYHNSMIKYESKFKELLPLEIRTLAELDNGQENPFNDDIWRLQYDKDEEIEINKEILCDKTTLGAIKRVVVKDVEVEDDGLSIQHEIIKYYHVGKTKKYWNLWKELKKLWQRRKKSIDRHQNGERKNLPSLIDFDSNSWEIDDNVMKELRDPVICEEKYYGFAWIHDLELSPDYKGNRTFDDLISCGTEGAVEIRINSVKKTESKKKFIYYQVLAEDVTGQENRINVWPDDWEWWHSEFGWEEIDGKSEFVAGNLLRVRLQPPSGGFNTFILQSNQIGKWRNKKIYYNKSDDIRVCVMRKGQKEQEKFLSDEEAMNKFTNCIME